MQQVEQAIFAPSRTDGAAGYQVVAASPGVCEPDLRELATWCPAHDSLLEGNGESESLNFHPLPSGAYCVSRTVPQNWQGHGGRQPVETHCLIVPREVLARFGNNPFALAQAATIAGIWQSHSSNSQWLAPLTIPGGAAAVDQPLLDSLAADPGPEVVAALVQAASQSLCLALAGGDRSASLIAGLLNCLPPECRLDFSFATGLKFSPRRPFRLVAVSDDPAQRCWIAQYPNVTLLDIDEASALRAMPLGDWASMIQRTLFTGQVPLLATELSKRRFHLSVDDLPALGMQLLESLDACELHPSPDETPAEEEKSVIRAGHAAHSRFLGNSQPRPAGVSAASSCLNLSQPEVLDRLERLDDLVYDSINGQPGVFEQLRTAWPELAEELGEESLAESREQYLRYALSIWEQCSTSDGLRHPARALQALDVLCLLFGDAT
ncbi:MAG: hypothetical protein ABFC96_02160 [Thermoguttaceae bacterium]